MRGKCITRVFSGGVSIGKKFLEKLYRTSQGYMALPYPPNLPAHLGLEFGGSVSIDLKDDRKSTRTAVKDGGSMMERGEDGQFSAVGRCENE